MYNILIVDDETVLVDSLCEYIDRRSTGEFECAKAYTSQQALELAAQIRIDIAILDIEMPGMNGIELSKRLRQLYPHNRTIFLTAYERFEYAYIAGQQKSRFLLKTEGYDSLLRVLKEEAEALDDDLLHFSLNRTGMDMLPGYGRNDFLRMIVSGEYTQADIEREALRFPMALNFQKNVMPVLLRRMPSDAGGSGQEALIRAAVFFCELFREKYVSVFLQLSGDTVLYLIQPAVTAFVDLKQDLELFLGKLLPVTKCKFCIALADDFTPWDMLSEKLDAMRKRLENSPDDDEYIGQLDAAALTQERMDHLCEAIGAGIERGNEADIRGCISCALKFAAETDQSFTDRFLIQVEKLLLRQPYAEWESGYKQMLQYTRKLDNDPVEEDYVSIALEMAHIADDLRYRKSSEELRHAVRKACEYIDTHYSEDISLPDIARYVCLSSSYLSRIFKKETGMSTVERIKQTRIQEAIVLLRTTNMKIQDIASKVGYHSSRYFLAVFRAVTGSGPSEYREGRFNDKT